MATGTPSFEVIIEVVSLMRVSISREGQMADVMGRRLTVRLLRLSLLC